MADARVRRLSGVSSPGGKRRRLCCSASEVAAGPTLEDEWIPAPRFRGDKLRGNDGSAMCDSVREDPVLVSPAEELGLLVVALAFVDYAEEPGRARGLDDDDVALRVVDLDGDAEVVSWFVLVGNGERDLDRGLLLAVAVAPELQGVVR